MIQRALDPADGSPAELRALLLAHDAAVAKGEEERASQLIGRALRIEQAPAGLRARAIERAARTTGTGPTGPVDVRGAAAGNRERPAG
jgi:hypothetical protein